ncbi:MAG: hypothetical protein STHCBS139747_003513 [Sporothrix thermara]
MIAPKDLLKLLFVLLPALPMAMASTMEDIESSVDEIADMNEALYAMTRYQQQIQLTTHTACHFGNTDTCSDSTWYHRARGIYWESVLPIYDDFPGDVKIEIPVPDHMKAMKKKDDANKVVLV